MRAPVEIADDDPGLAAAFAALRDQVTAAEATALYRRLIANEDSGPAGRPQLSQERTIKDSGYWYGRVAASSRLDV